MTPPVKESGRWKQDFPIPIGEDSYVTRRELAKFLGLTSLAFLFGTAAAAGRKWWKRRMGAQGDALAVATIDEIPVGQYKLFRYPEVTDPCIVLRLELDKFAAFNQNCTHLSCPVLFNAAEKQLVCPCHHAFFSAEDGRVLAGPPKRPLARLNVTVENAQVWVHGFQEGTEEKKG